MNYNNFTISSLMAANNSHQQAVDQLSSNSKINYNSNSSGDRNRINSIHSNLARASKSSSTDFMDDNPQVYPRPTQCVQSWNYPCHQPVQQTFNQAPYSELWPPVASTFAISSNHTNVCIDPETKPLDEASFLSQHNTYDAIFTSKEIAARSGWNGLPTSSYNQTQKLFPVVSQANNSNIASSGRDNKDYLNIRDFPTTHQFAARMHESMPNSRPPMRKGRQVALSNVDHGHKCQIKHQVDVRSENLAQVQIVEQNGPVQGADNNDDGRQAQRTKLSEMLRLNRNARSRRQNLNFKEAMRELRRVIPDADSPSVQNFNKTATLILAKSYITMQTNAINELRRVLICLHQHTGFTEPQALSASVADLLSNNLPTTHGALTTASGTRGGDRSSFQSGIKVNGLAKSQGIMGNSQDTNNANNVKPANEYNSQNKVTPALLTELVAGMVRDQSSNSKRKSNISSAFPRTKSAKLSDRNATKSDKDEELTLLPSGPKASYNDSRRAIQMSSATYERDRLKSSTASAIVNFGGGDTSGLRVEKTTFDDEE